MAKLLKSGDAAKAMVGVLVGSTLSFFATRVADNRRAQVDDQRIVAAQFPVEYLSLEQCSFEIRSAVDKVTNYIDSRYDGRIVFSELERNFGDFRKTNDQCLLRILNLELLLAKYGDVSTAEHLEQMRSLVQTTRDKLQGIARSLDRRAPSSTYSSDEMNDLLIGIQEEWNMDLPLIRVAAKKYLARP